MEGKEGQSGNGSKNKIKIRKKIKSNKTSTQKKDERCKSLIHMIDITEEDLKKSYNQVRKELKNYSKDLVKKDEIVVLNKIDLLEDKEVKKIKDDFLKKYKGKLITLSTLDKKSISNIKSKILKYVS